MPGQPSDVRPGPSGEPSPYQGLMPYTEDDADYFFGREGEIVLIANNARANRFGVLYGPSGVGKSSVLRAGVARHIRDENRRRQERYGDLETVVAYLKEWRDDPSTALAAEIAAAFREADGTEVEIPADDLVGATTQLCEDRDVDLVVILDQFEEFWLYHRPEVGEFAEMLARLTAPSSTVNVMIAIREDALAWLDEFEGVVPDVFANTLRLDHLDEDSARSAITEPLVRFNAAHPEGQGWEIEPALVDALLHEVRTGRVKVDQLAESPSGVAHPEGDDVRIEAAYLQLVLKRLWDEETGQRSTTLRLDTLRRLGGAQEIVRQHLDRVMLEFSVPEMSVLADAFGHLVTPSGSKIAHRPGDLADFSGRDPALMAALLHKLAEGEQRILRDLPAPLDEPEAGPSYEIFHDVLAPALLDWRRRFLAETQSKQEQAALVAEKEQSEKVARDARNRLRKARALIGAMALLLIACVALAAWAVQSRSSAQAARDRSEESEKEAVRSQRRAALSNTVNRFNQAVSTDPSSALEQGLDFEFDDESDPDGRLQAAFRGAMDAADTDVLVDLGEPVVLASLVGNDSLVAVTKDGRVLVWDVAFQYPLRLEEEPAVDVELNDGQVLQAELAASQSFLVVTTIAGDPNNGGVVERHVASVALDTGEVQRLDLTAVQNPWLSVPSGGPAERLLVYDLAGHAVIWDVAANRTTALPSLGRQIDVAAIDTRGSYVAAMVRGTKTKVVVRRVGGGVVASTALVSNLTGAPLVFTGTLTFTGATSTVDQDDPMLVIRAQGLQSEVTRWDFLHEDSPTPMGDDVEWREVYAVTDLATSLGDQKDLGRLAVAGDKTVTIFKHDGTFESQTAPARDWITDVQTHPVDRAVFALAANEGYVELYRSNLDPPRPMWTFRGHRGRITDLSFAADGKHMVTASEDGTVRVWRMPVQMDYEWFVPDWILGARHTPDGSAVFGYSPLSTYVTRVDKNGDLKYAVAPLSGQAVGMDPAPDNARAVVVEYYCTVPLEVSVLKRVKAVPLEQNSPDSCATAAAWNPDPARSQVVAGTHDNVLISWDADTGKETRRVKIRDSGGYEVVGVAFSGDGSRIVVGTVNGPAGRIRVFDADLNPLETWPTDSFTTIDTSVDGRYVVTAGGSARVVTVWDYEDHGEPLHVLSEARGSLGQVTVSPDPDAARVAVPTSEGQVYVWDRASGRLLAMMRRHADAADEATFDPDDLDRMYSAGDDGFMVSYTCKVCGLGTDELKDAAEQLLAQEIDLGD